MKKFLAFLLAALMVFTFVSAMAEEQIVLKIYAQYADDDTKIPYDYAVAELAKAYPNVQLELIVQAQDDGATLLSLASTKQLPDIFQTGSGIFSTLLSGNGLVNRFLGMFGIESIIFMGDNRWFQFTLILTNLWKEFGYSTIVYLAAVSGVNQDLYEAAAIDGAGHWKQMVHVTLPSIMPTIVLMSCLAVGNVLNAGFDQIYAISNDMVTEVAEILDTFVFKLGITRQDFSRATAAGMFKSVICLFLVLATNAICRKLTDEGGIW